MTTLPFPRPASSAGRLHLSVALASLACLTPASPAAAQSQAGIATARFAPTDAELPNPERGWYKAGVGNLDRLNPEALDEAYRAGRRLVYARIDLAPYRTRPIPAAYLKKLEAGFETARRAGVKLIVRGVYNYPSGETAYRNAEDAPLAQVLHHIAQLKPLLHDNEDVIAFVQAGFIGAWGEWHTSSNGLTEPAARVQIRDALLAAVPQGRFVQFRYPPHLIEWTPELRTGPAATRLRVAFHNDCFMASRTDVGTFDEDATLRASQQEHMARLGDVAPFGGETCNPADDQNPEPRTSCADILREGARYNLTYLNDGYYRPLFHQRWIEQGCHDEVSRRMGYRLRLIEASHRRSARPGDAFGLSLVLANDGWARPFNPRPLELLLRDQRSGRVRAVSALSADPRGWVPGAEQKLSLRLTLPDDLASGTYDLFLALPDASARLRADPRYSIRFANRDDPASGQRWESGLGAFGTGTTLNVSGN